MYKRKFFEKGDDLVKWLNENNISPEQIIEIIPFPTTGSGYHREYELFYKEN